MGKYRERFLSIEDIMKINEHLARYLETSKLKWYGRLKDYGDKMIIELAVKDTRSNEGLRPYSVDVIMRDLEKVGLVHWILPVDDGYIMFEVEVVDEKAVKAMKT